MADNSFYIDIDHVVAILPTPTPMKLSFSILTGGWIKNLFPDKNYILEAREYLKQGFSIPEERYVFSNEVIKRLQQKREILQEQQEEHKWEHKMWDNFYRQNEYRRGGSEF